MKGVMRKNLLLAIAFSLAVWAYLLALGPLPLKSSAAVSAPPPPDLDEGISVVFSPSGGCTDAVVGELRKARQSVDIQAYAFTSTAIAKAVVDASGRGVRVRVLLDRSQKLDRYSAATYLSSCQIPVYIDEQTGIAHNKVMLIDGHVVITGSFNLTRAAEERNAENLLILHDRPRLYAAYEANFEHHLAHSTAFLPR